MKQRVTMQDIADAMGVGKATVSRAFRGDPKCGAALREKILRKAEEMGYAPDALQSLHMARLRGATKPQTGQVIAILDFSPPDVWGVKESPGGQMMLKGSAIQAARLGLRTELIQPLRDSMSMERLQKMLRARGIQGLIVAPMPEAGARLDFNFTGFSAVAIAHSLEYPRLHRISHNQYTSIWEAMECLHDKGYRRVGLAVGDDIEDRIQRRRHAAFRAFCRKHTDMASAPRFAYPVELFDTSKWRESFPGFLDWVGREQPEAIIGFADWIPTALRAGGYRVPEDILFFHCSLPPHAENESFPGIDPPWAKIGAAAVDQIFGQWARFEHGVPENPFELNLDGEIRGI